MKKLLLGLALSFSTLFTAQATLITPADDTVYTFSSERNTMSLYHLGSNGISSFGIYDVNHIDTTLELVNNSGLQLNIIKQDGTDSVYTDKGYYDWKEDTQFLFYFKLEGNIYYSGIDTDFFTVTQQKDFIHLRFGDACVCGSATFYLLPSQQYVPDVVDVPTPNILVLLLAMMGCVLVLRTKTKHK